MARDRKRRGRRPQGGDRSRDDVARDIGLGADDDAVDSPLGEGTAAPDPLAHSSADVDEARLAEAGLPAPGDDEDDDGARVYEDELHDDDDERERAPDAVEGDAVMRRRGGVHVEPEHRRSRGRLLTFFGHCIDELRRVQWPNRRQVGQATAVVLGFVVIAGGYLGLLDQLWQPLIEAIL